MEVAHDGLQADQEDDMVDGLTLTQVGSDDTVRVDVTSLTLGYNPSELAYWGNVVMNEQMFPAEDNAEEVEVGVKVSSSFPSQLKRQVPVPTSNLFRPSQLFGKHDVGKGCVERYFATQLSLLEVYRRGTAFQ